MSKIKASNTTLEIALKNLLMAFGFTYQPKNFYGKPDFVNKKSKIIIFIDVCFWHKCPKHYIEPKSNKKYWIPKIKRNVQRRREVKNYYKKKGWKVMRIWEHSLKAFPKQSSFEDSAFCRLILP